MKKILILGGGYAGLKCAVTLEKKLKNDDFSVTLISRHDYHYQTTLLHKVASGTYSARKARIFYRNLLKKVEFIKDIANKIDLQNRRVECVRGVYEYDYLVVCVGFRPNDFGIKGVSEYVHKIQSINSALKIRKNLELNFKDFPFKGDLNDLSVAVCGSGFTGVEFAAEFAKQADNLCKICGIDRNLVKIYLIGRGDRILPMFDEKLSRVAEDKLRKIGVTLVRGDVVECMKDGVVVRTGEKEQKFNANVVVWSAGVVGNELIKNSQIPNKNSRVEVNEFLQMPDKSEVFVIGDSAIANERDIIHAPTAQLASQMGEYCAKNLIKISQNKPLSEKFHFIHRGTVCAIGHTDGVGVAYGVNLKGEAAAFLKNIIENRWILSVSNLATVLKKGQFRFRSSD